MAKGKNTDKFKNKGRAILGGREPLPSSVEDFIKDETETSDPAAATKYTNTHLRASSQIPSQTTISQSQDPPKPDMEPLGRLHIEIRQDLMDQLLELVFQRKRDPYIKGRAATQRGIIEEALQHYFETRLK